MSDLKSQICDALAAWIRQRPGLEFGNYVSPGTISREQITEGRRAYFKEARDIARDKRDAETLLAAVRHNSAITAEMILDAAKHSFSGRLRIEMQNHQIREHGKMPYEEMRPRIEYDTGQYFPTEFRKAAAAVLAGALWDHMRDAMPKPTGMVKQVRGKGKDWQYEADFDNVEGVTPGDWLRNRFRKEFGSKLQRRWFN